MNVPASFVNLDANASFPTLPEIYNEIKPLRCLNPSSIHSGGQHARALIEEAREKVAALLGIKERGGTRVIFTSGATEANNTALYLAYWLFCEKKRSSAEIVASAIEHPSVLGPLERLKALGVNVRLVLPSGPFNPYHPQDFLDQCAETTTLLSVMAANNETGEILPVEEISRVVKERFPSIIIHSDGVQALGKLPLNFSELGVDMLSISAHKIGGLMGVGALVVREESYFQSLLLGGPQETHRRAGTENVLGIVAFGIAAELLLRRLNERSAAMLRNKTALEGYLASKLPDTKIVCKEMRTLPSTLSITFKGIRADDLVVALDLEGILVSSGAACASGKPEPSHVLSVRGLSEEEARATVRVSFTGEESSDTVERAAGIIIRAVERMRGEGGK